MRGALLGLLLFTVKASLAAQVSISVTEFGTLRAGETVTIEWKGLPSGVEELEILLAVEGRELPIRLTPQLAARTGVVVWKVPNLSAARARLAIRYGLDGEEIESEPGSPFAILPRRDAPTDIPIYREGEWWAPSDPAGPIPGSLGSDPAGPRIEEETESLPVLTSSSSSAAARPQEQENRIVRAVRVARIARPLRPRIPLEIPARI